MRHIYENAHVKSERALICAGALHCICICPHVNTDNTIIIKRMPLWVQVKILDIERTTWSVPSKSDEILTDKSEIPLTKPILLFPWHLPACGCLPVSVRLHVYSLFYFVSLSEHFSVSLCPFFINDLFTKYSNHSPVKYSSYFMQPASKTGATVSPALIEPGPFNWPSRLIIT